MAEKSGCSLNWGGFDKAINNAGKKLHMHTELLSSIGEGLVSGTIARFDKEVSPEGKPWPQSKRAMEEGGKTLTDTGRLRNSVDYLTTGDAVMVGTNAKYARIHQKGGTITPKNKKRLMWKGPDGKTVSAEKVEMPERPFIGVSKEDLADVQATIAAFMKGAFKG
ncbi:MAG: phage virion morphogenesis protein [Desulfovibrionaceae bacterium]|nr:phage virion morphogenesis protein [Desulfovibrionaceae bacterium]